MKKVGIWMNDANKAPTPQKIEGFGHVLPMQQCNPQLETRVHK